MKKFLLFLIAALTTVGFTMAQDVYSTGYYIDANGRWIAVVYKNNQVLFQQDFEDADALSVSMDVDPQTGDVYYVRNTTYGDVFRNNDLYLNNPLTDTYINHIAFADGKLCSGGYKTVAGVKVAALWVNNNVNAVIYGDGNEDSEILGVDTDKGAVIACGYQCVDGQKRGMVWVNHNEFDHYQNAEVKDITVYNQALYYLVISNQKTIVYRNGIELYELNEDESNMAYDIKVYGEDVYVTGYKGSNDVCVWKNGELLYNHTLGNYGFLRASQTTTEGVYYVGCDSDNHGVVFKNGELLYSIQNANLLDLYVAEQECSSESARSLPYFEGFEMGATDWNCWTVGDEGANGTEEITAPVLSYWHRSGLGSDIAPMTGDYCAAHRYNESFEQEGWLISPQIALQARGEVTLTFNSYELWSDDCAYEGVWISTTDNNPTSFTELWNGTEQVTEEWKQVQIDLSAYQGRTVYIAFKYTGVDSHTWFIDDVNITASSSPGMTYNLAVNCDPNQGRVTGSGTYPEGTVVSIQAYPFDGFEFIGWSDDVPDNPRAVVVTHDLTLVALFKPVSVNEFGETILSVYPNPANQTLYIEGIENNTEVMIFNSLGMMVKTLTVNAETEINVSDLSAGLYLIRCGNQTLRFVKE